MSSGSSSSNSQRRRATVGIPNRCWCGSNLTTFGVKTKENLFRRFYRCEIGVKRQSEHHLFKWIYEAIIDEIRLVDSKQSQLHEDVQSFKNTTTLHLQEQGKYVEDSLLKMKRIIQNQTLQLAEFRRYSTQDNDTAVVDATLESLNNGSSITKAQSPLINIAAAAIALGTMAWLYAKTST
ncbi:unnamed protein product [Eruca vesicaria subsp. sativa]|uniref:GRF-type domain-containing protein n=1 Tax=Eruca vesicaria subsp. sativa TaxID=29727 RepID=A0ABC8LB62_ERUVS|nr:unnamed protein product [Eruca vesicaria subsp. sativa]